MTLNLIALARAATIALGGALLLASCGGSSSSSSYTATRVLAFGDEFSVITNAQRKYTVNAVSPGTNSVDCGSSPIWIQSVAAIYGLVFPQCAGLTPDPQSRIYAANGALVADLTGQIDQHLLNGGFAAGDLVTVLVGANDVVEQFNQYPAIGEDQLLSNLDAAGNELARQVNRLADLGAKVLVSTIPDMGLTPFAGDRSNGTTNSNPGLLTRLSTRFNDAMLANLTNDGRRIGLVQLDEYLQAVDRARQLGGGNYANTSDAACTVALPLCTSNTVQADASTTVWLWADDRHLGPTGQAALGSLAATRAQNNPF
jgi:phospholipase/lecithinase/hemolysin